jgi:hypothetical protein
MAIKSLSWDFIKSAMPVMVPPCPTGHHYVDLAVRITPYLLGSSLPVDLSIGRVPKLLGDVIEAGVHAALIFITLCIVLAASSGCSPRK